MPAPRPKLRALIGLALAGLPAVLAFAPGLPAADPSVASPGLQISLEAGTPGGRGTTERVALAGGDGLVVAAVGAGAGRPTRLVELRPGRPARLVRAYPHGASRPTVGTDAGGRDVVLVRTCSGPETADEGEPSDCGIEVTDVATRRSHPLRGSAGASIAAMDRGAVVVATGLRLRATAAPGADGRPGQTTALPLPTAARLDTDLGSVAELDLRDGVVAATFTLQAAFGGSQLSRFDPGRGWTTLGVSTDGGAAIGPRAYYAPTITPTGIRAFFDGAEDLPGFAGRWTTTTKPVQAVRGAPLGNPVHLRSAAFAGDRLLVFTWEDRCDLDDCQIASFGPFPVG